MFFLDRVEFSEAANTPIPGGTVVNIRVPADTQDRRDGKSLGTVGRHAGWTENLPGFQGPFRTSLQALPGPQESNSSGPWVWGVRKSHTGDRGPIQHCGCAAITRMCSNGRHGGNGKPHQYQPQIISDPNSITRDNFGAFQATAGTTSPYKKRHQPQREHH